MLAFLYLQRYTELVYLSLPFTFIKCRVVPEIFGQEEGGGSVYKGHSLVASVVGFYLSGSCSWSLHLYFGCHAVVRMQRVLN